MSKNDFIFLLKECDLLIIPKKNKDEGGKGGKDDDKGKDAKKEEQTLYNRDHDAIVAEPALLL